MPCGAMAVQSTGFRPYAWQLLASRHVPNITRYVQNKLQTAELATVAPP